MNPEHTTTNSSITINSCMKKLISKTRIFAIAFLIGNLFFVNNGISQSVTVFSDDFSTNQSTSWTASGAIGASVWSVSRSGIDWGARRNTNPAYLELTNDVSATANADGWTLASTPTTSFLNPYNATLNSNCGLITWTFNMRQIQANPSGFGSTGRYGVAFILAGTSNSNSTTGQGYVVTLGDNGSNDPIRLQVYNGGLQGTLTNIIASNTTGLDDFGTEYLSIKVTYIPSSNQWGLFVRNDGATAFSDPAVGSLTSQGTATNNTYTGTSLPLMGGYWQGSTTASQTAFFDNVKITVNDNTAPIITCPSNITISCGASLLPANTGTATATDNCTATGSIVITYSDNVSPGVCGGTITRTWKAKDAANNESTCTQKITVSPAALPTMTAPAAITVACGARSASSTIPFSNGLSGGCLISGTSNGSTFTATPGACGGTVTETWTATDECGRGKIFHMTQFWIMQKKSKLKT